ncbi:GPI inositol-deacylase [Coccinella septempunctata]|uniref:GPI inositol-deacylase n=1 Tax=Coccinella septempunctata TaxID=41139 RepID=UPI001D080B11|nr:GPI inositol-deacylase [Coccinella septempunctata]
MVASINGFIILCLISTAAYFIGLLSFFADNEKDKCDMTYMFELPQYVRISNNFDKKFPKYGLYYYDEGPPHGSTPKFWGIPVLFIPGNAGSHKQVRSLASVALRKSVNKRLPYHFDYFTIDMNEELSGLSGGFLNDQLEYTNQSLHFILKLYKNQRFPPKAVVLIGHSMGGVIARKLAQMASSPVQIVITLASPHKRSPIILDEYISSFYEHVSDPIRSDITFVNLAGGFSDLLVPTTLTDSKDNNSIYAVTTHIPLSWAPSDHKQILWCKQTVLSLTRSLFDSVDPVKRQISESSDYRRRIFEHHLLQHSGTKAKLRERYYNQVDLEADAEWIEQLPRQYSVRFLKGTKKLHWYMIRIVNDPKHEILTLVALNLETVDWVYACRAYIPRKTYKICENGIHLTHLSTIDPSARYKRRSLTINLQDIRKNYSDEFTHVIFKVAPTQEPLVFHVDIHNSEERRMELKLPSWSNLWRKTVIQETAENALRYEITLPDLSHVIQSFYLYLKPIKCAKEAHHATVTLVVPWSNENNHKHFTDVDKSPFHVRLYNSKPNFTEKPAFLRFTLDPTCRYEISIQRSVKGTLNQLARFYSPLLIVNIATAVLLILKTQLQSLGSKKGCTSFFEALKTGTKPYYVLGLAKLGSAALSSTVLSKILPFNKGYDLKEEGTDFFLLPYVMYLISIGIIWLFASIITVWITFCESTIHKFILKFLIKTVPFTIIWSEYMISALQKVPYIVSVAIIFISFKTCGGLALGLGTIFYFLKLTQMSQDFIEATIFSLIKGFILKFRMKGKSKSTEEKQKDEMRDKPIECGDQCSKTEDISKKICSISSNNDADESSGDTSENSTTNRIDEKDEVTETIGHVGENDADKNVVKFSPPSSISFHGVMFLIWVLTTIINTPSVLTWARNYHFSSSLEPDPSFLPGFLLSLCTLALWQFEMPNTKKIWYKEVSYIINAIAVIGLIYAPIYIYRLNYLLSATVIVVVAHQIFAPVLPDDSNQSEDEDRIKYENIKTKLE